MLKPIFLELIGKRCSSLAQSEQAYCGASLAIGTVPYSQSQNVWTMKTMFEQNPSPTCCFDLVLDFGVA